MNKLTIETMLLELTDFCNYSCLMCDHGFRRFINKNKGIHGIPQGFIDINLVKNILNSLKTSIFYLKTISLFWQGESLLHPYFKEILSIVSSFIPEYIGGICIHTNAAHLNEEIAFLLLNMPGNSEVVFSIDAADEATYSSIRKKGRFRNVIQNICRFIKLKNVLKSKVRVVFQFIVMKENFNEIEEFIYYWCNFLKSSGKFPVISVGDESGEYTLLFRKLGTNPDNQKEADRLFLKAVKLLKQKGYLKEKKTLFKNEKKATICIAPFLTPIIRHDGSMSICCLDMKHYLGIGSLKEGNFTFNELWAGEKIQLIREYHINGEPEKIPFKKEGLSDPSFRHCRSCPGIFNPNVDDTQLIEFYNYVKTNREILK